MAINTKENKIKEIAFELIPKKLRFNLLHLLSDICFNIKEPVECDFTGELSKISKEIEALVSKINDVLMTPADKRNDFYESINTVKMNIIETARSVFVYERSVITLYEFLSDEKNLRDFEREKNLTNFEFDYSQICEDCFKYIYELNDDDIDDDAYEFFAARKKSQILSCLPLKMTKLKYNDYIKNFLENLCSDSSKNFVVNIIESYKNIFAPFKSGCYGKSFKYIADKLIEIWNMDFEKLSDEELDEIIETLEDTGKNVDEIKGFLSILYHDINYILNLALFSVDDEYLFEGDIMFKDLYFATKDIIKSKDNEVFIDDIIDRIYDKIESMESEIYAMNENFGDILNIINIENLSESVYTYVMTKIKIDENFDSELSDALDNYFDTEENNEDTDEKFLNDKINEFLEYVKNSVSEISNKKGKKLKNNFFGYIVCFYDEEECDKYIEFVIKSLSEMEKPNLYIIKLGILFEREGFDISDEHNHKFCDCGHHH